MNMNFLDQSVNIVLFLSLSVFHFQDRKQLPVSAESDVLVTLVEMMNMNGTVLD